MAGHGPLAANPEDLAMQRHISKNFISGQTVAADGMKIPGHTACATAKAVPAG
jgi:hypothetical protein